MWVFSDMVSKTFKSKMSISITSPVAVLVPIILLNWVSLRLSQVGRISTSACTFEGCLLHIYQVATLCHLVFCYSSSIECANCLVSVRVVHFRMIPSIAQHCATNWSHGGCANLGNSPYLRLDQCMLNLARCQTALLPLVLPARDPCLIDPVRKKLSRFGRNLR